MKPTRVFNANEGDYSVGLAGPDAIERDIDELTKMFDPLLKHEYGEDGGISEENIQENAITDRLIGERIIDDNIADEYTDKGFIAKLLSLFAKTIKEIKGTNKWSDRPTDNIKGLSDKIKVTNDNVNVVNSNLVKHEVSGNHDHLYYTREELDLYLPGGDTQRKEEVYTILTKDNGDGTFYYSDGSDTYSGLVTPEGYQTFFLQEGTYMLGSHAIVIWINDTLRRSKRSGGLVENNNISFTLTQPEDPGAEITIEYYERHGMGGEHNIIKSPLKPITKNNSTLWFRVLNK